MKETKAVMSKLTRRWLVIIVGALVLGGIVAVGICVHSAHYVEGFAEVVPGRLYRCRQPRGEQWGLLRRHNIHVVVNLRPEGENPKDFQEERQACQAAGVESVNIPIGDPLPDYDQIRQFIRVVRASKGPVLLHCEHGRNRTGYMIATYRVVAQNWSPDKAWDEICEYSSEPQGQKKDNLMGILSTLQRDRAAWLAQTDPNAQATTAASPAK